MTPDVADTAVLRFADGEYVVPRWWTRLAAFRQGPEHGALAPTLTMTLEEAREMVNRELERNAIAGVMNRWVAEHRR